MNWVNSDCIIRVCVAYILTNYFCYNKIKKKNLNKKLKTKFIFIKGSHFNCRIIKIYIQITKHRVNISLDDFCHFMYYLRITTNDHDNP